MTLTAPERPRVDEPAPPGWRRPALRAGAVVLALAALALLSWRHAPTGVSGGPPGGTVLTGATAWAVTGGVGAVALVLLVVGLVRPPAAWRYDKTGPRDLRIDLMRGIAVVFVVLNHVNLPSLFQLGSQETIGVVSGAELFVALSGVVLGVVYRTRIERTDVLDATGALWRRAWLLYRTALVVVLVVFLVTLVPGVEGRVVTSFTDEGTGQTYGLYPNVERLLDYPVPGFVLRDILLLRLGPYQFNVIGLYVVLLALAPLLLAALRRRLVLPLLAASAGLYAWGLVHPTRIIGTQFEDPFPLLNWQVLFVLGLAAGWHRETLLAWSRRPVGRAVVALLVLGHLALLFFTWNNPYLSHAYDVRLGLVPDDTFLRLYADWFERRALEPGRLLDVVLVLVTLYALLSVYWRPVHRALGWFLVPLGQATLYVFVLHVFVALLVANVPGLDRGDVLLGTVAHAGTLAALWTMVRTRFLFRLVPR